MSTGLRGFRDACIIVLSSGYSIGFLIAVTLHLLLPMEPVVDGKKQDITDVKKGLYDPTNPRRAENPTYDSDSPHKPVETAEMFRDDTAGRQHELPREEV